MKIGSAAALAAALALGGCATTALSRAAEESKALDARVEQAARLIAIGSPENLEEAARLLSAEVVQKDARAAGLQYIGATISTKLFPFLARPFPWGIHPSEDAAFAAFPFFAAVTPTLVALDGLSPLDETTLAAMDAQLLHVDGLAAGSALTPYLRGTIALLRSEPGDAREFFEQALRRVPGFAPAAVKLSALIIAQGTAASELPLLQSLAAVLPSPAMRFEALARAFLAAGKPAQAADAAAQGLLLSSDDPVFARLRAKALDAQGDWQRAIRALDALLQNVPDDAEALLEKARILYEEAKDSAAALKLLEEAQPRFPSDASFPELRGRILLETDRPDEGVASLQEALRIEPTRHSTLSLLLKQAVQSKRWDEAALLLDRIPVATRSTDDLRLGWTLATGLADPSRALGFARDLVARNGGAAAVALEARSLIALGRAPQALSVIESALPAAGAIQSELYTLHALAGSQDPTNDLRLALRADPDNREALLALVDLLTAQQDYRKAADYLRHAAKLSPTDLGLAQKLHDLEALAGSGN